MYLVKSCSSCGRKIRFPIDKGKIKVRCQCGNSFIADPDDPSLFKNGDFDLAVEPSGINKLVNTLKSLMKKYNSEKVITALYSIKYMLQNYRLLPAKQQRKIILYFLTGLAIIALIVLLSHCPGSGPDVPQNII